MHNEDKKIIELKKVIESSHVNFLIGSGASRPFLDTLGNIEVDLTAVSSSISELEKLNLLNASIFVEYLKNCLFGNILFCNEGLSNYIENSLEDKVKQFSQVKLSYEHFVDNIYKIINSRDIKLLSKQVNIFTTNVDVFFEESLESKKFCFNDGFDGRKELIFSTANFHNSTHKLSTHYEYISEVPLFNLFKLHGSLNWIKAADKSNNEYNIAGDYNLNNLRDLYEFWYKHKDIFVEYSEVSRAIMFDDFSFLDNFTIHSEKIDEFLQLYYQLIMINPTKQKFADTTRNVHYYEMLRMYANHLERENSVLFVCGFSFSDEHIQKITQRVAKSNPTLIIYILCAKNEIESFEKIFTSFSNIKFLSPDDDSFFTMSDLNSCLTKIIDTIPFN